MPLCMYHSISPTAPTAKGSCIQATVLHRVPPYPASFPYRPHAQVTLPFHLKPSNPKRAKYEATTTTASFQYQPQTRPRPHLLPSLNSKPRTTKGVQR